MGLNYKETPDSCINIESEFESIAIEVNDIYDKQNAIIAEIYRVPNTNERISIERYDEFVTQLCQTKMDIIIGTDQYFDLMKVHTNRNISDVLDVFSQQVYSRQCEDPPVLHIRVQQSLITYR